MLVQSNHGCGTVQCKQRTSERLKDLKGSTCTFETRLDWKYWCLFNQCHYDLDTAVCTRLSGQNPNYPDMKGWTTLPELLLNQPCFWKIRHDNLSCSRIEKGCQTFFGIRNEDWQNKRLGMYGKNVEAFTFRGESLVGAPLFWKTGLKTPVIRTKVFSPRRR